MITSEQLAEALRCTPSRANLWVDALNAAMALHDISTPKRMACFLSQLAHESAHLSRLSESFNYTPESILLTFNTPTIIRFTRDQAYRYGRTAEHPADQKMIAAIAYANRMGNRNVDSGDGFVFRGRGPMQLTGRKNIRLCGKALGYDLEANPALLERPDVGAMSAAWFWAAGNPTGKSLNALADKGEVIAISKAVNGGTNGLKERVAMTAGALKVLA